MPQAITEERDAEERAHALRSLGLEPGATIPPGLRAQLKALEDDQKRRATRSLRDGIDRILVDLLSLYRDILVLQLGVEVEPVNLAIYSELAAAARAGRRCAPSPRSMRSRPRANGSRAMWPPPSRSRRC